MADIFTNSKRTAVYYDMGTFQNDPQRRRYVRAPFDLIQMQGNTESLFAEYFVPTGIGDDISQAYGSNVVTEKEILGREGFAFHTLNNVVIGQNEVGNWGGRGDSWVGMHRIDMI